MKKCLALLLTVLLALPLGGMALPSSAQETSYAHEATVYKGTPTVDGDLSEWQDVPSYSLSQRVTNQTAGITGSFQALYDGTALYFAGQIADPTDNKGNDQVKFLFDFDGVPAGEIPVTFADRPHAGVHSWNGEGINGAGGNSLDPKPWNPVNAYNALQNAGTAVMGNGRNYSLFFFRYADGVYSFEASWYPTDALKSKLKEGTVIGFDIRYNDFNDAVSPTDSRHTTIGWASDEADWNTDLRAIGALKLAGYQDVTEGLQFISCRDERLTYLGRWKDNGETQRVSYWTTPSVSFSFTGSTLYLDLGEKSSIGVELDGEVTEYMAANGKMIIPVKGDGIHTVKFYGPNMHFNGVYVAPTATVSAVEPKPYYAMFIGDSITADHRSFSFNSARKAGWDWSVLCLDGIALSTENIGYYHSGVTGWGYYTQGYYNPDPLAGWNESMRIGMEEAFFNYERPLDKLKDFTPYNDFQNEREPNAIFIALGVNDHMSSDSLCRTFVSDYTAFVQKLRRCYPHATIYMMQALGDNGYGTRLSSIRQAAQEIAKTDKNVIFVADTPTWGVEISPDGVHPSADGYATLTEKVKGLLEQFTPYEDDGSTPDSSGDGSDNDPGESSDSEKPDDGASSNHDQESEKEPDRESSADDPKNPATGYTGYALSVLLLVCTSGGALLALRRKKRI